MVSKLKELIKDRWVLFAVLLVYLIFKIPHLSFPYYWDEGWPYASAIASMARHGISLLPGALDPDLSRGHPLLFHALAATWMRLFGSSHIAMHSFALLVAFSLLVAVYETGLKFFSRNVAIISTLLIATQVVFFVQSAFVMLEIMTALWTILALRAYASGRGWLTALWLTALVFTKESGLILAFVLLADSGVSLALGKTPVRTRLYALLSVLVPFALIGFFFVVQKQLRGWYVYPMHTDMVVWKWDAFWYKFRMSCMRLLFYENYKFYSYLLLMLLSVVATIRSRKYWLLVMLLPAVILYYYVDDMRAGRILPAIPFFVLFLAAVGWFAFTYTGKAFGERLDQRRFFYIGLIFVLGYSAFSTINFFTYRYLMSALVVMYMLAAILFDITIRFSWSWVLYPVTAVILITGFYTFRYNENFGDCDLGAFRAMKVQQHVVAYLEGQNAWDSTITTSSALNSQHLMNPETGFLSSARSFSHVQYGISPATAFILFDNIEPDDREQAIKNDQTYILADSCRTGAVWAHIYKRKQ